VQNARFKISVRLTRGGDRLRDRLQLRLRDLPRRLLGGDLDDLPFIGGDLERLLL
jgi:hypothetical protein